MTNFDQQQKLNKYIKSAIEETDSLQKNEILMVLVGNLTSTTLELAITKYFVENCIKIGKNAYVIPLHEDKINKSKALKRVCEKLNAVMAIDLAKNEKIENEGESVSFSSSSGKFGVSPTLKGPVKSKKDQMLIKSSNKLNNTKQQEDEPKNNITSKTKEQLQNFFDDLFKPNEKKPSGNVGFSQQPQIRETQRTSNQISIDSDSENNARALGKKRIENALQNQNDNKWNRKENNIQAIRSGNFSERIKIFLSTVTLTNEKPYFFSERFQKTKEKEKLLQERGIHSNLKDFASFKHLCQLKSQYFQASKLADHMNSIEGINLRFNPQLFKQLFTPEEEVLGQISLEKQFAIQIDREPYKMRELREALYRSIFLFFGPILDNDQKGWCRQIARMNEQDRIRYRQKRYEEKGGPVKDFSEVQERNQRYCWFDALILLISKLKYYIFFNVREPKSEFKECYDVILSLILMIESPRLVEQSLEVMYK